MVCYAASTSDLAQCDRISSAEFLRHPLIKYQFLPANPAAYRKDPLSSVGQPGLFASLYEQGNVLLSVSTLETLKKLLTVNIGITSMPGAIVYNDPTFLAGQIKLLRFSDIYIPIHYYLIYASNRPLSAAETAFVAALRATFASARAHLAPNE